MFLLANCYGFSIVILNRSFMNKPHTKSGLIVRAYFDFYIGIKRVIISMPVSEISWTLPSQPCFQLYGTKRKNTDKEEQVIQDSLVIPYAKKMCFLPLEQGQRNQQSIAKNEWLENSKNLEHNGSNTQHVNIVMQQTQCTDTQANENSIEMMDSDVAMEETSLNNEQIQHINSYQQQHLKQQELGQQRELLIKRTEKLEEQLKFIQEQGVESNDYWAAPSDDSRLTMQDELEQARIQMESDFSPDPYQYSYHSGPDALPLMGYDVKSKVRCYCKPTWEGVMSQNCFM
ncbi:uncharacterized protein LOC117105562 [Anneissia japonica]|uniref:uncharacterized protein LOC117105562 n=1 Tax=Anneissia japonica TaxID=1529436 RepID=UPI0014256A35|nr:uncharacterized protein LOC117105562 [Anneissia japonica]